MLKKLLHSSYTYITLLCFMFLIILFKTVVINYKSKYANGDSFIVGIVLNVKIDGQKTDFVLKGREKIKCQIYNYNKIINIGDKLTIYGEIYEPLENTIPSNFNYKKYLYNQKIYKIVKVKKIIETEKNNNVLFKIKRFIYNKVNNSEYLKLFIIGDKSSLGDNYNMYKNIGVAHLLAISGMHVSIIVLIFKHVFFFMSKNKLNVIISLFLLFYCFLTSFSPSIVKVTLIFILNSLNKRFNYNISNIRILIICIFILCTINPFIIYNVGFLYSILCSLTIIVIKKYLTNNYIKDLLIISFFITFMTLPLTINLNYEINLVLFISNFILIPYVSFILFPFALLTFIFPFLNLIFQKLVLVMEIIANILNKVTFFKIIIPKMSFFTIVIYYLILFLFIYYNKKKYLFFLITLLIIIKIIPYLHNYFEIIYFDVKQGDSSVIISPFDKEILMIDTGGIRDYQVSNNVILFLKSKGISKVNKLILTHGDYDHMGEAINLVNNFKVEKVIFNCGPYNNLEQELIKVLDKNKIKYYSCIKELNIDKNKLYFLQTKEYDNENDNSNVIYTKLNGYKFMFMGDASMTTENEILNKYNLPDIDVLKVGHHGSKTSSGKEFISEIKPKYSVISVGKKNRYGHPNREVLDNLNNSKIYRTDQNGSIVFKIKNNRLKIETCRP